MNPTTTTSWSKLKKLKNEAAEIHLSDRFKLDSNRFNHFSLETEELLFDFSKHHIDENTLNTLFDFAKEQQLDEEKNKFFGGEKINTTENRAVMHTALRLPKSSTTVIDGKNVVSDVHLELSKVEVFTEKVLSGDFKGFSGEKITDVVNIGIGGSDLGPKMIVKSLREYRNHLNVHFVSNIDDAALNTVFSQINLESTLFIIVSKTFTTIETLTNANTAREKIISYFGSADAVANHFVAVSTNIHKVEEFGIKTENIFAFWDWVGGRYSLWSVVGLSISLAVGFNHFKALLEGANAADNHFKTQKQENNIPVIMALLDVWYNNFFDYRSLAVIPYAEDLSLFPKFLQQLDMESNGKSVDKEGNKIDYKTSNVIWGEAGTDSQHSFFQFLHQGADIVPVDFIGVKKENQNTHQKILISNLLAQSKALMEGTIDAKLDPADPYANHKHFEGNRPSSTLILKELTPHNLGFLTAIYEHKVFVQGVLWNVFSFDQWGVQLGKKLATSIASLEKNDLENLDSSTKGLYHFLRY